MVDNQADTNARRRMTTFWIVGLGLMLGYAAMRGSIWTGGAQLHTVMEAVATLLALIVGAMALVRFYAKENNTFLFIGTGFLGTAFLDGYHAIVTSDFFKPFMPSELPALIPWSWVASVKNRAERARTVRSLMSRDSLTGLLNHANIKEQLSLEVSLARRSGDKFVFVMIDIDHFKRVNDNHGHPTGDQVIHNLAQMLSRRLRKSDVIGRYGGEEFAVILVDTDRYKARDHRRHPPELRQPHP